MSTVLARPNEIGLGLAAGHSAGQHAVVDGAASLLVSLSGNAGAHACLPFDIAVDAVIVADMMRP